MSVQSFGEMIRIARRIKGVSMEKIGVALGTSTTYVSYMERGIKNPPAEPMLRIWLETLGIEDQLPVFLEAASRSAHRIAIYTIGKNKRATVAFAKIANRYEANALTDAEIQKLEELADSIDVASKA